MSTASTEQLVFVGFNSQIVALDRDTGELVWKWKSPSGSGYVAVLLDGDRLLVSVQGYTYCLIPESGHVLWTNRLEGLGVGVPCLASARGTTTGQSPLLASAKEQDDAASSSSTTSTSS